MSPSRTQPPFPAGNPHPHVPPSYTQVKPILRLCGINITCHPPTHPQYARKWFQTGKHLSCLHAHIYTLVFLFFLAPRSSAQIRYTGNKKGISKRKSECQSDEYNDKAQNKLGAGRIQSGFDPVPKAKRKGIRVTRVIMATCICKLKRV